MAYDYLKAQAQVNGQIAKYGNDGTFVKLGSSSGYDDSGNSTIGTPDINVDGIVTPLLKYKKHEMDGTKIIVGDAYVYFDSDNDAALEVGMLIAIGTKVYRLVGIDKLEHYDPNRPINDNSGINDGWEYYFNDIIFQGHGITVYVKLQLRS